MGFLLYLIIPTRSSLSNHLPIFFFDPVCWICLLLIQNEILLSQQESTVFIVFSVAQDLFCNLPDVLRASLHSSRHLCSTPLMNLWFHELYPHPWMKTSLTGCVSPISGHLHPAIGVNCTDVLLIYRFRAIHAKRFDAFRILHHRIVISQWNTNGKELLLCTPWSWPVFYDSCSKVALQSTLMVTYS